MYLDADSLPPNWQSYEMEPETQAIGDKGVPKITSDMVAGACAGLDRIPYLLVRIKYSGDASVINELAELICRRNDYQSTQTRHLMRAAVYEVVSDNICKFCNGTGVTRRTKCKSCDGSGHKPPTVKEISTLTGIPQTTYFRKWKEVYQNTVAALHKEVKIGVRHVSSKLFH